MENSNQDQPSKTIMEKDVLGLDKNPGGGSGTKAKPNRIFIILLIVAAIALTYWFITNN